MLFLDLIPFVEALQEVERKRLVPTALSSADLATLDAGVRRQALFSARLTQIRPLQALL